MAAHDCATSGDGRGDARVGGGPRGLQQRCEGGSDQAGLGLLFHNGQGVPQNYAETVKWSRKAADQGDDSAQLFLGLLYVDGSKGVPQGYVQAHMWLNLSAAQGNADAVKVRDALAHSMTPTQIGQAQALAAAWKPTTGQ